MIDCCVDKSQVESISVPSTYWTIDSDTSGFGDCICSWSSFSPFSESMPPLTFPLKKPLLISLLKKVLIWGVFHEMSVLMKQLRKTITRVSLLAKQMTVAVEIKNMERVPLLV